MLDSVGNLQALGIKGRVSDSKFWNEVDSSGIDSALIPAIREQFGLPEGVHEGSPSSEILDDVGILQLRGLDPGDLNNWSALDEWKQGITSGEQFFDKTNGNNCGGNNPGFATPGDNSVTNCPSVSHRILGRMALLMIG